jgi:hypothetical protein
MIRITSSPEIYATAIGLCGVVSSLDNKPFIYSMEHGFVVKPLFASEIKFIDMLRCGIWIEC